MARLAVTSPRVPAIALGGAGLAAGTAVAFAFGLLEPVSLLITVGGALAVARATFSRGRIEDAWRRLAAALAEPAETDGEAEVERVIARVKALARVHRIEGAPGLERALADEGCEAVRRAGSRVLEAVDADDLHALLEGEAEREGREGAAAVHVLHTLGKLFPAFGLIGTLLGLAQMLPRVGGDDVAAIGPGLGVAVLTTLYGAVLANAVVLPLATKLEESVARAAFRMRLAATGLELVQRREYPTRVEQAMRAFAGRGRAPGRVPAVIVLHERAA